MSNLLNSTYKESAQRHAGECAASHICQSMFVVSDAREAHKVGEEGDEELDEGAHSGWQFAPFLQVKNEKDGKTAHVGSVSGREGEVLVL